MFPILMVFWYVMAEVAANTVRWLGVDTTGGFMGASTTPKLVIADAVKPQISDEQFNEQEAEKIVFLGSYTISEASPQLEELTDLSERPIASYYRKRLPSRNVFQETYTVEVQDLPMEKPTADIVVAIDEEAFLNSLANFSKPERQAKNGTPVVGGPPQIDGNSDEDGDLSANVDESTQSRSSSKDSRQGNTTYSNPFPDCGLHEQLLVSPIGGKYICARQGEVDEHIEWDHDRPVWAPFSLNDNYVTDNYGRSTKKKPNYADTPPSNFPPIASYQPSTTQTYVPLTYPKTQLPPGPQPVQCPTGWVCGQPVDQLPSGLPPGLYPVKPSKK